MLKLLVGISNFESLPAFARALREATSFIDKTSKESR